MLLCTFVYPLTEDIWLKFVSADYMFFPYNQGTPVYSRENSFQNFGIPEKTFESDWDSRENMLKFGQS